MGVVMGTSRQLINFWTAAMASRLIFLFAPLLLTPATASNTTASWLHKRSLMIDSVFGYGPGVLPTRSIPDAINPNVAPGGVCALTWNLSTVFEITSTVFYAPLSGDRSKPAKSAFLFHHGHSNCVCKNGTTPLDKAKCRPGCESSMHTLPGFNWWDLYNVTKFFHSLGHDVFILSMPLKGVNLGPGSNATHLNTDHWWMLQWEKKGDHALRYFLEPVVLTINYAKSLLKIPTIFMAGLSGGGWTTTVASALDKRIVASFPIAGSVPAALRDPNHGKDDEDFEQNASPNPNPGPYASHPGRLMYQACNYTCMYLLAGLEPDRFQVQVLHNQDDCCFAAKGRHDKMKEYEYNVRRELGGSDRSGAVSKHGWFTCTVDDHIHHEVCHKDKRIIRSVMEATQGPGWKPGDAAWQAIPCDILHGSEMECPEHYPPEPLCTAGSMVWSAGDESTATRIAVYTDGCFTVGVAGEPWLVSAGVELHVPSGAWLTSTDGSLYNKNASAYHGRDEIGSYSAYTIHWATPKWPGRYPTHLNFTTTFTAYDNGQMLTFTQSFGGNTSLNATVPSGTRCHLSRR